MLATRVNEVGMTRGRDDDLQYKFINPMIEQTQSPTRDQGRQPVVASVSPVSYRFSGHQTFPLRIAWLPKAVTEVSKGKDPLTNIDEGIISLGLGKNMVESLRCWIEAFQIASKVEGRWELTPIGELIFSPSSGFDPYLEDHSTSWLLHWLISTNTKAPFFAWECLFNRWPAPEFSATTVLEEFRQESDRAQKTPSDVTLRQHWEVFVHSYRPRRGVKAEDHLDCALSVLGLIREAGERRNSAGKLETVYSFDMGARTAIPQQLFTFFIHDWWNRFFPDEQTIPISEIVAGAHCPGRILKMQENEILRRVADIARRQSRVFQVTESASLRQLRRLRKSNGRTDLRSAYKSPRFL
ncbi:MAG: DUF4007 domain-containing protein [gamma proteobacterium symbiont of Ctena orbiculata]|nr:MAG: DUF4007 domain-containing protein [gamma proteobacterium symbiont of Ctena orbiculata]